MGFFGKLTKNGGPGTPPEFDAAVADLDIDAPGISDAEEDQPAGGLLLPQSLYSGVNFPATASGNCVNLSVNLRPKWAGPPANPTKVGDLKFEIVGGGANGVALYKPDGTILIDETKTSASIAIPPGDHTGTYHILTNDNFIASAGITATFTWDAKLEGSGVYKTAIDDVRLERLEMALVSLTPGQDLELGEDLTVEYTIGPAGFSVDSAELQIYNSSNVLVYKKTGLDPSAGTHTTTWEDAKWNQNPYSGAYANPNNGDYSVKIVAFVAGTSYTSNVDTINTKFVVEADIEDVKTGTVSKAAGLADLGNAIEVIVEKDATIHAFSPPDVVLTNNNNVKQLKLDNGTLNALVDGEWKVQLKDVRDDIGNFYDSDLTTPSIDHDEWTVELR